MRQAFDYEANRIFRKEMYKKSIKVYFIDFRKLSIKSSKINF